MEDNPYYFEIKPKNKLGINFRELIDYKELFYFFTWRDLKIKYRQTVLGFFWAILQPVILVLIFTFIIGKSLFETADGMKYPVFVFSGLILWLIFSSGLINAGNSLVSNAQIIKKIYFPRLVIPVSAILVALFDFVVTFPVFVVLIIVSGQTFNLLDALIFWPIGILLTLVGTIGPSCLLAALNVKYRDFRYVIPFLVQALLFLTPVIYPVSILKGHWLQYALAINPMYGALTVFRFPMTQIAPDPAMLVISVCSGLFFLLFGLFYFSRTESFFADLT